MNSGKFNWLIAAITVAVFLLDIISPLGISASRFYLVSVLLTYREGGRKPVLVAGICVVLTIVGAVLSPGRGTWSADCFSRMADIVFVIIAALFVFKMSRTRQDRARLAADVIQKKSELNVEKALREVESRYRVFMDNASDAIFLYDNRGVILEVNHQACESLGRLKRELIGKAPPFFSKHASDDFMQDVIRRLHARERVTFDSIHRHEERGEFPVEVRICPFEVDGKGMALAIARNITERKRAEEELRASERRFRELADAIPEIIWTATPDGSLNHLNSRAMEYTGIPTEELKGWSWGQAIHPDDLPQTVEIWTGVLKRGTPQDIEFRIRRADGEYRWHICRQSPGYASDGSIACWYGSCPDIETQKRAEAALRLERDRFNTIAATAPGVICSLRMRADGTYCFPYVSPVIVNAYGFSPQILATDASPIFDAVFSEDVERVLQTLQESAKTLMPWRERFRIHHPERGIVWIESHGKPTCGEDGSIEWYGFVTDVTEHQQAKIELERQQAEMNLIFDTVPALIFYKDINHHLVRVNQELVRVIGRSKEEIEGKTSAEIGSPYSNKYELDEDEIIASGSSMYGIVEPIHTLTGTRWLRTDKIPTRDESGNVNGIIGFSVDITERKNAEEALLESDARLRSLGSNLPDGVIYQYQRWPDDRKQIVYFSRGLEQLLGVMANSILADPKALHSLILPEDAARLDVLERHSMKSLASIVCEFRVRTTDGQLRWLHARSSPRRQADASVIWDGVMIDVTERKQIEHAVAGQNRVMERVATGSLLGEILEQVVELVEDQLPNTFCSILLYDAAENRLRFGAGQSLPSEYSACVDGILAGPCVGSCGTAVHQREPVIVSDISQDPLWADFRDLALSHGLRSCWSVPIFSRPRDGDQEAHVRVLGAFAIYKQVEWEPGPDASHAVAMATYLAGVAIERESDEQALRQSEERYRSLVDHAPAGFYVNVDNKFAYVNDATCRLMGATSKEQLLGTSTLDRMPAEIHETMHARIDRVRKRGEAASLIAHQYLRLDGTVIDVETMAIPIQFDHRPAIQVLINDISERKQAEEKLHAAERRLALLFRSSPVGICISALDDGAIIDVNDVYLDIAQSTREETIGRRTIDLGWWLDPYERLKLGQVLKKHGALKNCELAHRRKDGTVGYTIRSFERLTLDGQECILTMFHDITDSKRAEEKLRATEKRLSTLFRASPVGICISTMEEGRVLEANDAYVNIAGYRRGEVIGKHTIEFGQWIDTEKRTELVTELKQHGSVKNWEIAFRRKDGSIGYSLRSFERLRLDDQDCILTMVSDITDRKSIDEELQRSRQRLEVLSRQLITTQETERRHLARELHDEIGQVLTAIKMNLRRTQRGADSVVQSNLEENVTMVEQAIAQVRNLSLSLRPPQLDQLGLVAALHWVVKYQAQIGGFQETLDAEIGKCTIPDGIAIVCFRITQEALTNAVRHAAPRNCRVELRVIEKQLYLMIRDDGAGFDVAQARQRANTGASLGLLSMQERMSLVGGRLVIDSIIGQGTKIQAWFPLESP